MGGALNSIGSAISSVASGVTNFVENAASTVTEAASSALQSITDGFSGAVNSAASAISGLTSGVGGFGSLSQLFGKLLGGSGPAGGNIENFLKELMSKFTGQAQLENGTTVNTGAVPQRDFTAEMTAMQQVLAQMQANGQIPAGSFLAGVAGTATGAATAAPATTTTATNATGNSGDATSIVNNMRAQMQGGTGGLSSYQSNLLAGVKDPDQRAQMEAQMKMSNLTRDAQFYSEMAKLMDESLKGVIRNMG